jgi:hypothetical protein
MDQKRRSQKKCPRITYLKSVGALLVFLLSGCLSSPKPTKFDKVKIKQTPMEEKAIALTEEGESRQPKFSVNGNSFVYVGFNKSLHQEAQIYDFDLIKKSSRRITYNDGENLFPDLSRDGTLLTYSSTTDSIKENPDIPSLLRQTNGTVPIGLDERIIAKGKYLDVYLSSRSGGSIQRLSYTKGPDLNPKFDKEGKVLISWVQPESKKMISYSSSGVKTKGDTRLTNLETDARSSLLLPAIGGSASLISKDGLEFLKVKFLENKKLNTAESPKFETIHSFSEGKSTIGGLFLVISGKLSGNNNLDLYLWYLNQSPAILHTLTGHPADDLDPSVSPDGSQVLYSSNRQDNFQIYLLSGLNDITHKSSPDFQKQIETK